MDKNLIKSVSPSPTGVKYTSKDHHGNKKKRSPNKGKKHSTDSSSPQGKVIDDYA